MVVFLSNRMTKLVRVGDASRPTRDVTSTHLKPPGRFLRRVSYARTTCGPQCISVYVIGAGLTFSSSTGSIVLIHIVPILAHIRQQAKQTHQRARRPRVYTTDTRAGVQSSLTGNAFLEY